MNYREIKRLISDKTLRDYIIISIIYGGTRSLI